MEYRQAILKLNQFKSLGINLGLRRINDLLEIFGHPEEQFPIIHIGGTNGKGSTTAMLASILKEAGYQVGVFSSPHLISHRERFMINGEYISEKEFTALFAEVLGALEQVEQDVGSLPTEFEILTAMTFLYFARKQIDLALVEVGLGGDFDSTNVVKHPLLTIITNVSYDHQDRLGNTLVEIAEKKSGIIKANCPVITMSKGEDVLRIIREKAEDLAAPFWEIQREVAWEIISETDEGQAFSLKTPFNDYPQLFVPLQGEHQIENAITAVFAAEILQKKGWRVGSEAIKAGIVKVKWPGRLELIGCKPCFVLDGAHNLAGFMVLSQWLTKRKQNRRLVLVIGMLDNKDWDWAARFLKPLVDAVIITRPNSERTVHWQDLKNHFQGNLPLTCIEDIGEALEKARSLAGDDGLVLVTGSLHLMGKAREILQCSKNNSPGI
ncbi:MAG TPA: bifunctional folylpolyglutamate synthase/dihydrofolate synthase [Clostridia bacterium]|jgi:dihydrofolate synthase/folylpolyglutamate synthase|nr:bifunctional folylpolyglutamate synthase/dihydrofolate synthase [Clostridia bacterium]